MEGYAGAVLYPTLEVGYVQMPDGVVQWKLPSGREFMFDAGAVWTRGVIAYLPLARVPDWQSAIQFSLGFDAGRTLQLLERFVKK